MTDQLIYKINGKRYILVDVLHVEGYEKKASAFIERNGLIFQGIKELNRGGWLSNAAVVKTYFLPEENFDRYSKDKI